MATLGVHVAELAEEARPAPRRHPIAGARLFRCGRDEANLHATLWDSNTFMTSSLPSADLIQMLQCSRRRTLALVAGLTPEQLIGPQLDIVNPLLWEIGHVAWFHEHFILRHLDARPLFLATADES